ncbi:TNF receptor-associated factor 2-like isoform X2 [Dreissena polymorpha]|nr:TNF receptor-associated factor 2-like isoform X2 [Dreissena polymorpha]
MASWTGYPKEIATGNSVDKKFICNRCGNILREPVQATCGDRFCRGCVEVLFQDGAEQKECPRPNCMDEDDSTQRSVISKAEIFPDNAIKREINRMKVHCINKDCKWNGKFKEYESHFPICEFRMATCAACGSEVKMNEMERHLRDVCPKAQLQCSDCGNLITREDWEQHQVSHRSVLCPACPSGTTVDREAFHDHFNRERHSTYVFHALHSSSTEIQRVATELALIKDDILARVQLLDEKIVAINAGGGSSSGVLNPDQRVRQLFEQMSKSLNDRVDTKTGTFEGIANTLHRELDKVISAIEKLENHRRNMKDVVDSSAQRINALEQTLRVRESKIIELEQKLMDNNPLVSYNGVFIWKFTDFLRKQQEAQQGRNVSHYSTPFFTSRFGYKMCARLYPNGDGMGKGTHLSVFFVVMKGEYDALQEWPFKQRVTFCLLNQERGSHVVDSFRPDPTSSSFRRPQNNMNIASGCPLFVRLDALVSPGNGLLKDDTVFLKIIVDSTDIRDPSSPLDSTAAKA